MPSSLVLLTVASSRAGIVTRIFNLSLATYSIPSIFKSVNVIPVPKIKNPTRCSEYRPISLLSSLAKLLEAFIIRKWIEPYTDRGIFTDQFAFLPYKKMAPALNLL